jgi:hypothetical protein
MTAPLRRISVPRRDHRHAVWVYFRFPLGLRMVEELLAARGIIVSHETVRQWARKFGQQFANQIRRRLPRAGDKWHLDEVVLKITAQGTVPCASSPNARAHSGHAILSATEGDWANGTRPSGTEISPALAKMGDIVRFGIPPTSPEDTEFHF